MPTVTRLPKFRVTWRVTTLVETFVVASDEDAAIAKVQNGDYDGTPEMLEYIEGDEYEAELDSPALVAD